MSLLAWLKNPTAAPRLPRLEVIADAYAALNPSDELWRKYSAEIERLRDAGDLGPEDFYVLRVSVEARRELMVSTYGDGDELDSERIGDILRRAHEHAQTELREVLEEERSAHAESAEQAAESLRLQRLEVENERRARALAEEAAKRAAVEARQATNEIEALRGGRDRAIDRVADAMSACCVWGLGGVLSLLIVVGSILSQTDDALPSWLWVPLVAPVTVLGVWSLISGWSVLRLLRQVRRSVRERVRLSLHRLFA